MITARLLFAFSVTLLVRPVEASFDISYGEDDDLTDFVTRPEIKAPLLDILPHDPSAIHPGHIFVAPYAKTYQQQFPTSYSIPCQTGAHIYDSHGSLVWTQACDLRNANVADFRPFTLANGTHRLSAIVTSLFSADHPSSSSSSSDEGYGYVLDASYLPIVPRLRAPAHARGFRAQELKLVDGGGSALHLVHRERFVDLSGLTPAGNGSGRGGGGGWVVDVGFREVDLGTGEVRFEWWGLDHLDLRESGAEVLGAEGPPPVAWDAIGVNSVDKGAHGDYLLSAGSMDAVFRISGKNGSVLWQLGGKSSTFQLQGFDMVRPHDARFVQPDGRRTSSGQRTAYVLFVNGVADSAADDASTPSPSSAMIVALDGSRMVATVDRRVVRPDGGSSPFGGNAQLLSNGNFWIAWGCDGYASEHDQDGRVVMEARFRSDRFTTCRAYKSDFKAAPLASPALKCTAYGTAVAKAVTVCYVSWSGATEVRHWRFRNGASTVGTVVRHGFETMIQLRGYMQTMTVEGLSAEGEVLGISTEEKVSMVKNRLADATQIRPDERPILHKEL